MRAAQEGCGGRRFGARGGATSAAAARVSGTLGVLVRVWDSRGGVWEHEYGTSMRFITPVEMLLSD
eukprot:1047311-Prymnesium_polylepis.1